MKFIQAMHLKKGALHRDLNIPQGHKIPTATLIHASHGDGVTAKRARLALTMRGFKHHHED